MTLIRNSFGQRRRLALPAIDVTSHQCSPQSTSEGTQHYLSFLVYAIALDSFILSGIMESYQRACRLSNIDGRICSVLLLEEVGLAGLSPHLPLKVLHSILDESRVSLVGISNWALDPAKMNRAVLLLLHSCCPFFSPVSNECSHRSCFPSLPNGTGAPRATLTKRL